jgi:prevent-host-death family protein
VNPRGGDGNAVARRATVPAVSREISQRELRNESGEIMRALDRGETFVVTRSGAPVGELVPLRRHRFISAETAVATFRDAPSIEYKQFRRDLDRHAPQGAAPRG